MLDTVIMKVIIRFASSAGCTAKALKELKEAWDITQGSILPLT